MTPARLRRAAPVALLLLAACSTQPVGHDSYQSGRKRVVELLNDSGTVLPPGTTFEPVSLRDTDREICHRHFLGYAVGESGALQPEVTAIVDLPRGADGDRILKALDKHWSARHFRLDRSEANASQFPKVRARVGDYTLVATSFKNAPAFNNRMTLYVVGACLRS